MDFLDQIDFFDMIGFRSDTICAEDRAQGQDEAVRFVQALWPITIVGYH